MPMSRQLTALLLLLAVVLLVKFFVTYSHADDVEASLCHRLHRATVASTGVEPTLLVLVARQHAIEETL